MSLLETILCFIFDFGWFSWSLCYYLYSHVRPERRRKLRYNLLWGSVGYLWFPCGLLQSLVTLYLLLLPLPLQRSSSGILWSQGEVRQIRSYSRARSTFDQPMHRINHRSQSQNFVHGFLFRVMDLDRQLILTKDNITVNIDTCVYYRVIDAKSAYYSLENITASVAEVTYATLRTFCGENTLQDLLEKRQEISDKI